MNIQSIIVLAIILIFFIKAIIYTLQNNDHCAACGNKCSSCNKCSECSKV